MSGWAKRVGVIAASAFGAAAIACAGGGYDTDWNAEASSGFLSPANDTRSNFILLMADRYGTKVADPSRMAKGIVPFDFPYGVMLERMSPPRPNGDSADSYEQEMAQYGLSEDNHYFSYDSNNLGLCHSNRSGADQFAAAVRTDSAVPAGEKPVLVAAREQLAKACDKAIDLHFAQDAVTSPEGRAFGRYLDAARLFYAEDLPLAEKQFASIGTSSSSWLSETAAYMQFRTALAQAMKGSIGKWGDMADPAKRDRGAIDRAEVARQQFLRAYPSGRYSASARDLERRIAWLRGDTAALAADYSAMLQQKAAAGAQPDIATMQEIDRRILPASSGTGMTDPTLLAVMDLMRLRPTPDYDDKRQCCGPELSRAELEQQRPYFARQADLFGYLLAAEAFYHRHEPREVLALIPDAAHQSRFGYVQFSRQMLRGFALDALHDRNARGFWLSLLPGAVQPYQRGVVELAIYNHDKTAGMVGRLLETGSPVLHPLIRQKIIEDDAGPDLLRSQATAGITAQQRQVALYLLLANELHHGMYAQFLKDQQLVGTPPKNPGSWSVADYDPNYSEDLSPPPLEVFASNGSDDLRVCPNITSTATSLAADPSAIRPRLCLAEFLRRKGFDDWNQVYDGNKTADRARNFFPGKPLQRMDIYQQVIASPVASPDDKAFALNRAIRCYQPSRYNSCGGDDVPTATRKAWFDRLRKDYGSSTWARELKYYW